MPVTETQDPMEITVTAHKAADILDCHTATVTRMVDDGRLKGEQVAGEGSRYRIPLTAVIRQIQEPGVRREVLKAMFEDFGARYFEMLSDVLGQADRVRDLRDQVYGFDSDEAEPGDAREAFEALDTAVAELHQRVNAVHALRGTYLFIVRAMGDADNLFNGTGK